VGQARLTSKEVSLAVGGTKRVWDAPSGVPFKEVSIFVSSQGAALPPGTLVWTLIIGGTWQVGEAFADGATHTGGVAQVSGGILGGLEVTEEIKVPGSSFPPNLIDANGGYGGVPIVLELTNSMEALLSVKVSFLSHLVAE